ncbi:MAG TPA: mechanosensitive ion channel family protein [Solirubrobacteraceae bacterium]|nr:mechanosensitive ion channel family protein [Solirubrobacteraceae bacterium]
MPRQFKPRRDLNLDRMFETRSDAWEAAGLSVGFNERVVQRSRRQAVVLLPLFIAILVFWGRHWAILGQISYVHHNLSHLKHHTAWPTVLLVATMLSLVIVGWKLAGALGKLAGPTFLRRMDPATAGTVGFIVRILVVVVILLAVLSVAGTSIKALAVGGGFTAVVVGLAAQQTLGNAFAGIVLLSARPFRVGERVRLQAGAMGGQIDGIVSSLGLLYTTLTQGPEKWMIPNNLVLAAVVVPLKEPDSVDVRVRLTSGVRPSQVQAILDQEIGIPTSSKGVMLEEVDGDDVVVRVQATPQLADDGPRLADEIMKALASVTGEHETTGAR